MPLILVVEQEQRYVERITEALSTEGWSVEGVDNRAAAEKLILEKQAALVILNSEIEGSKDMLGAFSKSAGGPGTVLLIPESAGDEVAELDADEVVQKPFTAKVIRQAVRRCLSDETGRKSGAGAGSAAAEVAERSPAESADRAEPPTVAAGVVADASAASGKAAKKSGSALLTSEDIFGDVVSELESAISVGTATALVEEEAPQAESGEAVAPPADRASAAVATSESPRSEAAAQSAQVEAEEPEAAEPEVAEPEVAEEEAAEVEAAEEVVEKQVVAAAEETPDEAAASLEAPPEAPRPDPSEVLADRLRKAAEEGSRLAKGPADEVPATRTESADDLLRNALLGIKTSGTPPQRPQKASREEVDALLSTVVGPRRPVREPRPPAEASAAPKAPREESSAELLEEKAADDRSAEPAEPVETSPSRTDTAGLETGGPETGGPATGGPEMGGPATGGTDTAAAAPVTGEADGEAPVSIERDLAEATLGDGEEPPGADDAAQEASATGYSSALEVDEPGEERSQETRTKLIWAIIIIVFLALLAFVFAGRAGAAEADSSSRGALGAAVTRVAETRIDPGQSRMPATPEYRPGDSRTANGDAEVTKWL